MLPRGTSVRVTWWEFALRLALVAGLLVAIDATLRLRVPTSPRDFDTAYRLPSDASLHDLGPFVRHVRKVSATHPDDLIVVFLGASPAYGVGIGDGQNTFAAVFASAAASDSPASGRRIRAYNLAANGLLLGDQYVIAKALGDAADLFVVQLTYQTFDPRRSSSRMRESDLPSMLNVGITADEARALDTEARTATSLDRIIDETVRSRWFSLEHKVEVAKALSLADTPEWLYGLVAGRTDASGEAAAAVLEDELGDDVADETGDVVGDEGSAADPTTPFDELDPALQMVAISRASENSRFTLDADNGELRMLARLARLLRTNDAPAVFFLAPMNEEILASYEVLDEGQYERNVQRLHKALADDGFELIDYHPEPFLTSADFVDLTHTTDSGGALTGERLWQDLRSYVESIPAR